jgi:hypothetical protein
VSRCFLVPVANASLDRWIDKTVANRGVHWSRLALPRDSVGAIVLRHQLSTGSDTLQKRWTKYVCEVCGDVDGAGPRASELGVREQMFWQDAAGFRPLSKLGYVASRAELMM